jgi:retron-type reverse transcriptase
LGLAKLARWLELDAVETPGVVVATERGPPPGRPSRAALSNIVLDRELDARGHRFVRYADDCNVRSNVYVKSKRSGQRVMAILKHFIEKM